MVRAEQLTPRFAAAAVGRKLDGSNSVRKIDLLYWSGEMFCKHQWEVLSETTIESQFEHAMKVAQSRGAYGSIKIPGQMSCAERKHILVVTCKKCGKIKRFVETI